MNIREMLWDSARSSHKGSIPILSFPAVQMMNVTVEQLVKDPELMAQAIALVAAETDTLAAVSPMDLSVEAEAFGAQVRFDENEIPAVIGALVSDEDEAAALEVPDLTAARIPLCIEAVRRAKQRIVDKPVLAGTIGPYSLAGRLMDVTEILYACYDDPDVVHTVLDKATQFLIAYANGMKEAGAAGIMMAEPLTGLLGPDMAEEFSVPYVKRIIEAVQTDDFAVIYHNCGNSVSAQLPQIFSQNAAAYHFGNAVDMAFVMENAPSDALCMGNIDPAAQFTHGTPETMTAAVRELKTKCGKYENFLPSSGCDIPAHAPWENINAFFAAL